MPKPRRACLPQCPRFNNCNPRGIRGLRFLVGTRNDMWGDHPVTPSPRQADEGSKTFGGLRVPMPRRACLPAASRFYHCNLAGLVGLRFLAGARNDGHCPHPVTPSPPRADEGSKTFVGYSYQSFAKSLHWGFTDSMSATFLERRQPLICFSLAMAETTSLVTS